MSFESCGVDAEPFVKDIARDSQSHALARNLWYSMVLTS